LPSRERSSATDRNAEVAPVPISRQEVKDRVLVALRDKLMRRDLFADFCREYVRELNWLRMEQRAGLLGARSKLVAVEREIRKRVQAIKDGVSALSIKDELLFLESRKAELQSRRKCSGDAGAAVPAQGRRLSREGHEPL
jgi:hypothetical protein